MVKKRATVTTTSSLYGNYSKKIEGKFKQLGIVLGDRIQISDGNKQLEGNLLAQNELGDPNSILVKLDNGYNLGMKFKSTVEIMKLEGSVELESFQIRVPKQNANLPEISLLATGGTIASRIDYQTGGVVMAMQPEEIFASLPELFDEVSFRGVKSLFNLGSEDMFNNEWKTIAENAANELNDGSQGVVISHGTDTMAYTSAALSFMLQQLPGPVVLTGAQRSSDRGSFDGAINLISAARVAATADIGSVVICMHESSNDDACQISRGTKVRKMHTSRRDAFRTINDLPLARITVEGEIEEINPDITRRSTGTVKLNTNFETNVSLVKIFPGIDPELIDWYIDKGVRGLILEGTGLGHIPSFPPKGEEHRSLIPKLQRAIDDEIFIGMTSQCLYGRVHPFVYRALRTAYQMGVTYLGDMIPETAYIKMGWVLGNYQDMTKVKDKMLTNMAGEISPLSKYQEFMI
ncbi:MAG: Glu-tRNA(Gln) amidotransferase subunit GatD [Candidatus Kariarchaeaceae archaeon]|jgi:glutamyl-tRNA(Gln) amidotransferase subunit D